MENNRQTVLPAPAQFSITLPIDWLSSQSFKDSYVSCAFVHFCSVQLLFKSDLNNSLARTLNYSPQRGLIKPTGQLSWNCFVIWYSSVAPNEPPRVFNMVRVANLSTFHPIFELICLTWQPWACSLFHFSTAKGGTKYLTACWRLSISKAIFCSKESHCMVLPTSRR